MNKPTTIKVNVYASSNLDEAKLAVMDLLVQLNHSFVPRGVEFVLANDTNDESLAIVLYWRDFGDLPLPEFEAAYESLKTGGNPTKIYVFFREGADELDKAMRAFKDSFATRYGHFYCHFEHLDSVRFQLATQCLSYLPARADDLIKLNDDGKVSLLGHHIADMENLPFAKMNSKRKSLKRQIEAAEEEVATLESEAEGSPEDADLKDSLREARKRRHDLKEELKQYEGFLFCVAVDLAKKIGAETGDRVREAWQLFLQGKAQEANRLLDRTELEAQRDWNRRLRDTLKKGSEKIILSFLAKAKLVLADESLTVPERVDEACLNYDDAIAEAREIHWKDESLAEVMYDYAELLHSQRRFQQSALLFNEVVEIRRRLADENPIVGEPHLAGALNNLAVSRLAVAHNDMQQRERAEKEYVEAIDIYRRHATTNPGAYEQSLAGVLNNLANLHSIAHQLEKAEWEYAEALNIRRRIAVENPEAHEFDLAGTLNDIANFHSDIQQQELAEKEYTEALGIYRRFATTNHEAAHMRNLARTLYNLANLHSGACQHETAEKEYVEAIGIYRRLVIFNPEAYEQSLADSLNNLGKVHAVTHQREWAEKEYVEAIEIYSRLVTMNPIPNAQNLAGVVNNLAVLHSDMLRIEDAEREYSFALGLFRGLAPINPKAYEPYVAMTLNNLAELHGDTQRLGEAEREYCEALQIFRRWRPQIKETDIAKILGALAVLHRDTQQFEKSETEFGEALGIYCKLCTCDLNRYEPYVAATLLGLTTLYKALPRREKDMIACAKEALSVCLKCDARRPGQFAGSIKTLRTWLG